MPHMVYSYLRVSGRGQVEKDGPDRQREAISTFCKGHKLQQVGEAFEKGVSGTVESLDRPAFADMLDRIVCAAKNGLIIEAIVVERMDRLARDLMVSELLLAECRRFNIQVFSADQGALIDMASDGGDPTRVLMRQMMGALAQWDKSMLVRRLRVARERKKALTGRCDGTKPYGTYPGEQATLDYLFAIKDIEPKPSYRQLARSMAVAGLHNRKGKPYSAPQIHDLIKRYSRQTAA